MTTIRQPRAAGRSTRRRVGEKSVELGVARFLLVEEGIKAADLGSDILRKGCRIKQMAEPQQPDQPIGCRRVVEPREWQIGHEMDMYGLDRLDLKPDRAGADRGMQIPVE